MNKEVIATVNAPGAVGPYVQAVKAGGTVYCSGQLGIDPATGKQRMDSFPDVFYNSLDKWRDLAEVFMGGDRAAFATALERGYGGAALA